MGICLTMDKMDAVPTMPFIGDGVTFMGKKREFVKCNAHAPRLDMSAWDPEGPEPTENNNGDNDEEPICDFNADTRVLDCSSRKFDDASAEKMLNRLRITHAYPVDSAGVRKQVKKEAVWKLNFNDSPGLTDTKLFLDCLKEFTFARELRAQNTGMMISKGQIHHAMARVKPRSSNNVALHNY